MSVRHASSLGSRSSCVPPRRAFGRMGRHAPGRFSVFHPRTTRHDLATEASGPDPGRLVALIPLAKRPILYYTPTKGENMPAVGERRSEEAWTERRTKSGVEAESPGCAAPRLRLLKARCPQRVPERPIGPMLASARWLLGSMYWTAAFGSKAVRRARSVQRGVNLEHHPVLERLHNKRHFAACSNCATPLEHAT
jgi:hypothetical protein